MTAVTHNDDLYYYVLFALLQIGNPQDYEKKNQARPEALSPTSGQAVPGRLNFHNS